MAERLARHEAIVAEHGEELAAKARELVATGAVVVPTTAGDIEARIVRFRWGDAVVEITRSSPPGPYSSSSTSRTRLSRHHGPGLAEVVAFYLTEAVVSSGGEMRPA